MSAVRIDVFTIFPEYVAAPLGASLLGKARSRGVLDLRVHDLREWTDDPHRSVDDTPFGGGAGMVMRPDVVDAALDAALKAAAPGTPAIYLTPRGRLLDQRRVRELAAGPGVVALCGRFEGVDQRVIEARQLEEISLGDFVLSGGEPAALTLIDACVRLLPGVVGAEASLAEESFEAGLLEYPHYTRPQSWCGRAVPEVLLSGHHANVAAWRRAESEKITAERRPDLWARYRAAKSH